MCYFYLMEETAIKMRLDKFYKILIHIIMVKLKLSGLWVLDQQPKLNILLKWHKLCKIAEDSFNRL